VAEKPQTKQSFVPAQTKQGFVPVQNKAPAEQEEKVNHQDFPSMRAAGSVLLTRNGVTKTMAEWGKEAAENEALDASMIAQDQAEQKARQPKK
jgi:hypothetical protein